MGAGGERWRSWRSVLWHLLALSSERQISSALSQNREKLAQGPDESGYLSNRRGSRHSMTNLSAYQLAKKKKRKEKKKKHRTYFIKHCYSYLLKMSILKVFKIKTS